MTANPLAGVIGSPISGALLNLHGGGLAGWQWMFLIEGLPAIVLGGVVYFTLADAPSEAQWLQTEERTWLLGKLSEEQSVDAKIGLRSIGKVLLSPKIWMLSAVYFGVSTTMYGVTLWLPSVIRAISGFSYLWTGIVAVLPFLFTVIVMVLVGMRSDRKGERRWHTAISAFIAAAGLVVAGYGHSTLLILTGIAIGLAFAEAMCGPFWAMATSGMDDISAAAGIAVINSLANLGGYFGPDIIGFFRTSNGGFRGGLVAIATTLAVSGIFALIVGRTKSHRLPIRF
jgi:ACS family tartrate transporter-like MFS transporter